MKKYIIMTVALLSMVAMTSCSDMIESTSERQIFDLNLNQKTDSLFFTYGLMNAMQLLGDQYVIQNEVRGDLTSTTEYSDNNLRQMAVFSATASNKYDSAYVYYSLINNCNYYITHRDTTLMNGSKNVVINEYAAVKALRAWAYLQLARTYGKVPFYTDALTQISQIDNSNYPELDINGIVAALAPDLEQYTGLDVPNYGTIDCGLTNTNTHKYAQSRLCLVPVDVILGDMYLETGDYASSARHFYTYLYNKKINSANYATSSDKSVENMTDFTLPSDFAFYTSAGMSNWSNIFVNYSSANDIITYIPMAVNKLKGAVTGLPILFGYNFYSTSTSADSLWTNKVQITPSDAYNQLSDSADYYYQSTTASPIGSVVRQIKIGDMRKWGSITERTDADKNTFTCINKYKYGNIIIYRNTTVYLHLAEALNRLGYPDAAFAILKDGLKNKMLSDTTYLSQSAKDLLTKTYPFFSTDNMTIFDDNYGIHQHGCGAASGTFSPYQMNTVIGSKMREIAQTYNVAVGTSKKDSINAMEDLLCDEYAMEFAFEGNRMADLCRMARHKNSEALYGENFGSIWMAKKLAFKNPSKDLTDKQNWYLPFK